MHLGHEYLSVYLFEVSMAHETLFIVINIRVLSGLYTINQTH